MTTLVIDTSVIVKWLNQDNELYTDNADTILKDVRNDKVELLAPELCKYEVGNVLLYGKKLNKTEAEVALHAFYSLPITLITESEELAHDTFAFASTLAITYYDAAFLALAKQYNATLITDNLKHQGKMSGIKVIPIKEY